MRHTQHQLFDTLLRGGLDDRLEQRHEALASFEAVLLVLRIRGALVVLEGFGGDERGEHTHGFGVAQSRRPAQRLHPRPQPSLLFLGTHVPALERERTAVARLQASEQLRQRAGGRAASKLDWIRERIVEQKPVVPRIQLGDAREMRGSRRQRIDRRRAISMGAVARDQRCGRVSEFVVLRPGQRQIRSLGEFRQRFGHGRERAHKRHQGLRGTQPARTGRSMGNALFKVVLARL